MKNSIYFKIAALSFACGLILLSACTKEAEDNAFLNNNPKTGTLLKSGQNGTATYIVVLNDDFEAAGELKEVRGYDKRKEVMTGYLNRYLNGKGIDKEQVEHVYNNVFLGFSVKLNGPQLQRLQQDPRVRSIEPDQAIALGKPGTPPAPQPSQVIPWGVTRVGGPGNGIGKTAWVIDSGIDLDHPDLNVNITLSRNFVTSDKKNKGDDLYGHGTACAGQIAAINNSFGTVGVAAGATVVAVRVLNEYGSGTSSWFIAGADYVAATAKPGDVVNISLGYPPSPDIDNAVLVLGAKGIKVALSAGNESTLSYRSPSRVNGDNIYTVSAMGEGDLWASFSNYGNPPVDFCAPGINCYTTYKNGTYLNGGGTSASAPYVAGLLLLGAINTNGFVIGDPDGNPDPIAHR